MKTFGSFLAALFLLPILGPILMLWAILDEFYQTLKRQ